ncbi:TPA: hypothetical protein ACG1QI_002833, partial [Enterobacter kobei]
IMFSSLWLKKTRPVSRDEQNAILPLRLNNAEGSVGRLVVVVRHNAHKYSIKIKPACVMCIFSANYDFVVT